MVSIFINFIFFILFCFNKYFVHFKKAKNILNFFFSIIKIGLFADSHKIKFSCKAIIFMINFSKDFKDSLVLMFISLASSWIVINFLIKTEFFFCRKNEDFSSVAKALWVRDLKGLHIIKMSAIPLGLEAYIPPVSHKLHPQLTLLLFIVGFFLFSWLFIYQITTRKQDRSFMREISLGIVVSILWGMAGLFGMLWAGLYI